MICPSCNIPMNHLNEWGWFSGTDAYQTYDYLKCKWCTRTAVEFYHTEFVDLSHGFPKVSVKLTTPNRWPNSASRPNSTKLC